MSIFVATRADAHLGTTHFGVSRQDAYGGLRQYGAAWHAPGSRVVCDRREIPQVGETYGVVGVHSGGAWGLESGVNEHALAVSGEAIATREPGEVSVGLSGHDLVRLALERGRNAREALEVLAGLVERFGYGHPSPPNDGAAGEARDHRFLFADPGEAWCLECSGRRWAARRITRRLPVEDGVAPEIRDNWEIGAKGLEAYARERRWCEGPGRLDFAAVYGERPAPAPSEVRRGTVGRPELEALFRERGAAATSFHVALPHDRRRPWPLWVCAGPDAAGVFLPVYLDALLPLEALGDESGCAKGAFEALARSAGSQSEVAQARLREAWKSFEADLERERRQVEREATVLFNAQKDIQAREHLTIWSASLWASAATRATQLADALEAAGADSVEA